jgi:hypothetical protein
LALIQAYVTQECIRARLNELEGLETHRHYGKDYQDSLDELAEYKENRIKALTESLERGET